MAESAADPSADAEVDPAGDPPRGTGHGFGRILVGIYGFLALAATARSIVQIATKFHEAPLAYLLSGLSGLIYVVATVSLARGDGTSRRVATAAISFELVGVLAVGVASLVKPSAFPDASVWSRFGSGYGYLPLLLPFIGLWWLRHTRRPS